MKIATRLRLFAPGLVVITAVMVGLVVYWGYRSLVDEERVRGLTARADADGSRVTLALQQIQDDIRFLADLPKIMEFIEACRRGDAQAVSVAEQQTVDIFASLLQNRPHYDQVRLIGSADDGLELIRVERLADTVARIGDIDMQHKGHRDYVQDTLALPRGRIYVSEISLNREQGVLEVPHRPAFRVAIPLYDGSDGVFGLVIINLNFTSLVRSLLPVEGSNFEYFMTNEDGGYVIHPDPNMAFGFELGLPETLQSDYPELAALLRPGSDTANATATIAMAGSEPGLMQARRLHPFNEDPSRFLVLALAASADSINAPSQYIGTRVLLATVVLLAIASALAFAFASHLTKPLKQLTDSADRVTGRQDATFLYKDRNDEIGTLSRALDHMVKSLRQNEISLQESIRDLEYFSRIASHDLTEPARRIAALVNLVQLDESERLSDDGRDVLDRLRAQGLNMVRQLTDMRAFARLGSSELVREETDLRTLVEHVVADRADEIHRRRIVVRIDPMPVVSIYNRLVDMLYHNLVDNALQHATQEVFELTFSCTKSGEELVFGVCNTGSKIAVDLETMFDAFYTGSSDSSRSGLGLSICRRIVERHAGRIWAEHESDRIEILFTLAGADR